MADKKPKEIVLLKDRLDNIFENFGSNVSSAGKKGNFCRTRKFFK